ncbi:hypothetical protein V8E36_005655 [Tilletia maclaganii]
MHDRLTSTIYRSCTSLTRSQAQIGGIIVRAINRTGVFQVTRVPSLSASSSAAAFAAVLGPRKISVGSDPVVVAPPSAAGPAMSTATSRLPFSTVVTAGSAGPSFSSTSRTNASSSIPSERAFPSETIKAQTRERRRELQEIIQRGKKQPVRVFRKEVTFLPQRLLDQKVNLADPDLGALISSRGCRVEVSIPSEPGSDEDVRNCITEAFKQNKIPVDLSRYGIQFAKFSTPGKTLRPVLLPSTSIDANKFEELYSNAACVIVPAEDTPDQTLPAIDPEFDRFRQRAAKPTKERRAPPSVITIRDSDDNTSDPDDQQQSVALRPKPRPFSTGGAGAASTPSSAEPASPVLCPPAAAYCLQCAEPLTAPEGHGGRTDWIAGVESEHLKTCPRKVGSLFTHNFARSQCDSSSLLLPFRF